MTPGDGAPLAGVGPLGSRSGPLTLIHTNNSPNPVSMRVPGVLSMSASAWQQGYQDGLLGVAVSPYPVGTTESWSWSSGLVEGRAARGIKKP